MMEQIKELEKQKANLKGLTPNFVLVNKGEIWEVGNLDQGNLGKFNQRGNIMHFNLKLEFPLFDGMNPRNWVKKCAKYFNLYKIPDDQKVDLASMYLQREAEIWFSSYILERRHVVWDDFTVDLYARFRGDMGREVVEEFNKLQQSRGLDDYLENFGELKALLLLKSPSLPNDYFVNSLIGGLKPSIKSFTGPFQPKTLPEAVEYARSQEEILEAIRRSQNFMRASTINSQKGLLPLLANCQRPRILVVNLTQMKPKTLTAGERAEKVTKGLCFFCDQPYKRGHKCNIKKT